MPLDELEQPQVDTTGETETQAPDTGSEQVQTDTPQTESKPDWRVERYGQDYENNHEYWKDTASYWRDEHKKERAKRQQGTRVLEEPNGNGVQPESQEGVQDEPEFKSVKDLIQYVKKDTERTLSERERESNFRSSIQRARQEFNAEEFTSQGFPSFDDLEEEVLAPLLKGSPKIREILREMPDSGSAAYTLALVLKAKTPRGLRDKIGRASCRERV